MNKSNNYNYINNKMIKLISLNNINNKKLILLYQSLTKDKQEKLDALLHNV